MIKARESASAPLPKAINNVAEMISTTVVIKDILTVVQYFPSDCKNLCIIPLKDAGIIAIKKKKSTLYVINVLSRVNSPLWRRTAMHSRPKAIKIIALGYRNVKRYVRESVSSFLLSLPSSTCANFGKNTPAIDVKKIPYGVW